MVHLDWAANKIKEASGGRMNIQWFYADELLSTDETFDAATQGVVPMIYTIMSYQKGFLPEVLAVDLPGTWRDMNDVYHAAYEEPWALQERMRQAYAEFNMHVVEPGHSGNIIPLCLNKEISSLEEFSKLKLRSFGIRNDWFAKTGAGTVYFPGGEIYTSLATNVVDGVTWKGASGNFNLGIHEVAKYWLPLKVHASFLGGQSMINTDSWNELPDDIKDMIHHYMFRAGRLYDFYERVDDGRFEEIVVKDWGVKYIDMPASDWNTLAEMGQDLWEEKATVNARALEWFRVMEDWLIFRGYLAEPVSTNWQVK